MSAEAGRDGDVAWTCPKCGAPFATRNASHSCVRIDLTAHFATAAPNVRAVFDRLVEQATADGPVEIVPQKTRIVLAAPMRFLAIEVRRDRLTGHLFLEREARHRVVTAIVPNAYNSGLVMHRLVIRAPEELDDRFAAILRESLTRVGRRERLRLRGR